MNIVNLERELLQGLAALGVELDAARVAALLGYLERMGRWNQTYNLTAIREPERQLSHHLLDSLAILPHLGEGPLLDVGSGAGLPGIPLAIARPELQVTLVDASQKKCAFMNQVAIELGLGNVRVWHGRIEALTDAGPFPVIVSRAFSDLAEFVRFTAHLLAEHGRWLAMKGVYPNEEVAHLKGVRGVQSHRLVIPGLEAERHLIVLCKENSA